MNEKSTIILSKEDLLEKVYALDSIGISKLNSILDTKQSELFALIEEKKWDKIFELLKSKDSPELSQLLSCTTQDIVASSSYDKSSPRITVIGKEDVQNIQSQEVTNLVTTLIHLILRVIKKLILFFERPIFLNLQSEKCFEEIKTKKW